MKVFRLFVVAAAIFAMAVPQAGFAAGNAVPPAPADVVQDVALDANHSLAGQVFDPQGRPHAGTVIVMRKDGRPIAQTTTGRDGKFAFAQLRPGVYEIASGDSSGVYRVWANRTAPPAATAGILLVDDNGVVRAAGQHNWRRGLLIGGLLITSGVIGGVIGYNVKDAS